MIPAFHSLSKMTFWKILVALLKFLIRGTGHQLNWLVNWPSGWGPLNNELPTRKRGCRGFDTWTGNVKSYKEIIWGPLEKQEYILPTEQLRGSMQCGLHGLCHHSLSEEIMLPLKSGEYKSAMDTIAIVKGTVFTFQGNFIWGIRAMAYHGITKKLTNGSSFSFQRQRGTSLSYFINDITIHFKIRCLNTFYKIFKVFFLLFG